MDKQSAVYRLPTFAIAKAVAEAIAELTGKDARIVSSEGGYLIRANLCFEEELSIVRACSSIGVPLRSASRWTSAEVRHVFQEYSHWHWPEDIALKIGRSTSAVCSKLREIGVWWEPSAVVGVERLPTFPFEVGDGCFSYRHGQLLSGIGVIRSGMPDSIDLDYNELREFFSLDELERIVAILLRWSDGEYAWWAVELARAGGLGVKTYFLSRQVERNPAEAYRVLRDLRGLDSELLYQREVLKAYLGKQVIFEYPSLLTDYMLNPRRGALGSRKTGCQSSNSKFGFGIDDYWRLNEIASAASCADDLESVRALVRDGNRLAALILARFFDLEILDGGNYRGVEAEEVERLCADYRPSESEISDSLRTAISVDMVYSARMSHLGEGARAA